MDAGCEILDCRSARRCGHWWFGGWDWLVNQLLGPLGLPRIVSGPGEIALDPHIHTLFSRCSISEPAHVLRWAWKLGLRGVAILDHGEIDGSQAAVRCADELKRERALPEDFLVIPGMEVASREGHIGALFVDEKLPGRRNVEETVRDIHEAGGLAVAVHPYSSAGVGDAVYDAPFDAVEVESGAVFAQGQVQRSLDLCWDARLSNVTKLGSSDAHYVRAIGSCYTVLRASEPSLEAARLALVNGHAIPHSSRTCTTLRRVLGAIPQLQ